MSRKRHVVEGTWTGYTSGQRQVCHVHVEQNEKTAEAIRDLGRILYTDGTSLILRVRPADRGERIKENRQYDELIRDCLRHGVRAVADLPPRVRAGS